MSRSLWDICVVGKNDRKDQKNLESKEQIQQLLAMAGEKVMRKWKKATYCFRQWTVMCHGGSGGEPLTLQTCTPMCCCFLQGLFAKNELIRINLQNKANKMLASAQGNWSNSSYRSGHNRSQMVIHKSIIILFHLEPFVLDYIQNYCKLLCKICFLSRKEKKRPLELIVLLCFN